MQRCGYIAILGRPNAGKSTLINALVGDKVAVVSRKPQTTRNRILGIALSGEAQLLFLDTPGMHHAQGGSLLNSVMNQVAAQTATEADLILYMVDAGRGLTSEDEGFLRKVLTNTPPTVPLLVLASKIDTIKGSRPRREALLQVTTAVRDLLAALPSERTCLGVQATAAKRPDDVQALRELLASHVPEGPWLYNADDLTDRPQAFLCAELIREQVFRQLGQEIPYGTAVRVHAIEPSPTKPDLVVVRASILASRRSQKAILVGQGGSRIKSLGAAARTSLERHFQSQVFLDLRVDVAEGWTSDQRLIAELAQISELPQLS